MTGAAEMGGGAQGTPLGKGAFALSQDSWCREGGVPLESSAVTTPRHWYFPLNAMWDLSDPLVISSALGIIFWPNFQLSSAEFELHASCIPSELKAREIRA